MEYLLLLYIITNTLAAVKDASDRDVSLKTFAIVIAMIFVFPMVACYNLYTGK
jgi:hypothetical protein